MPAKQWVDECGDALLTDPQLWGILASHGVHVNPKERIALALSEINSTSVTAAMKEKV